MHPRLRIRVKDIFDLRATQVPNSEILSDFPYLVLKQANPPPAGAGG